MDSQESQAGHPQTPHPQFHSLTQHHHHHQQQQHPSMMMARPLQQHHQNQQNNSFVVHNNVNVPPQHHNNNNSSSVPMMQQQPPQQQLQHQHQHNSGFPFSSTNLDYSDGASTTPATGFTMIEPAKKKRGRPRKYSPTTPDVNNIALGLSPTTPVTVPTTTPISSSALVPHNADSGDAPSSDNPSSKKARGRPPGSSKKQLDALGAGGVGFTPHVITVNVGEDIASKIMAFSQQGPRTVCILSANGAICNVTLRQPAMGSGTVTYEGRFEIISLSGSFLRTESDGNSSANGLSVSLAGPDGRILGGGVAGTLMAATPVQVIVGSFIAEGKKPKPKAAAPSLAPPPPNMLNFGAPVTGGASPPPSQGASSEESDENGNSPFHHEQGPYGNPGQPMHNMSMYANMGWPKSL